MANATHTANDTGLSAGTRTRRHPLGHCQHDAVILAGCVEAIALLDNADLDSANARTAVTDAALRLANKLADDLDALEREARNHG